MSTKPNHPIPASILHLIMLVYNLQAAVVFHVACVVVMTPCVSFKTDALSNLQLGTEIMFEVYCDDLQHRFEIEIWFRPLKQSTTR